MAMILDRALYLSDSQADINIQIDAKRFGGADNISASSLEYPPPDRITGKKSAETRRPMSDSDQGMIWWIRKLTSECVGGKSGSAEKDPVNN